jgi:hypothetical protein
MQTCSIEVSVRVAWWLPLYLHGLAFVCAVMRTEPDWVKVNRTLDRAIIVRVSHRS